MLKTVKTKIIFTVTLLKLSVVCVLNNDDDNNNNNAKKKKTLSLLHIIYDVTDEFHFYAFF